MDKTFWCNAPLGFIKMIHKKEWSGVNFLIMNGEEITNTVYCLGADYSLCEDEYAYDTKNQVVYFQNQDDLLNFEKTWGVCCAGFEADCKSLCIQNDSVVAWVETIYPGKYIFKSKSVGEDKHLIERIIIGENMPLVIALMKDSVKLHFEKKIDSLLAEIDNKLK